MRGFNLPPGVTGMEDEINPGPSACDCCGRTEDEIGLGEYARGVYCDNCALSHGVIDPESISGQD